MPVRQLQRPINFLAAFLVTLIVAGALFLSVQALMENKRFARTADQIFALEGQVRAAAADQKSFAQTPGENLWPPLAALGRDADHANAWGGDIAPTTTAYGLRIESDVPTHECRRLALYFIGFKQADTGLIAVEAQAPGNPWGQIYPLFSGSYSRTAGLACGAAPRARLALTFKIR